MIIDDDPDILEAISLMLEISGYRLVTAEHAGRALDMLRGGLRPALIILDLMMPGMDGWTFRAAQRSDPALAAIPVVILSGNQEAVRRSTDLEVAASLCKPVDGDSLVDTVERHRARDGGFPSET
jgi:CheY-like chemotaxis protein